MKQIIWLLEDGTEKLSENTWYNGEISLLEQAISSRTLGFHKQTGSFAAGISRDSENFNLIKGFKIKE